MNRIEGAAEDARSRHLPFQLDSAEAHRVSGCTPAASSASVTPMRFRRPSTAHGRPHTEVTPAHELRGTQVVTT